MIKKELAIQPTLTENAIKKASRTTKDLNDNCVWNEWNVEGSIRDISYFIEFTSKHVI